MQRSHWRSTLGQLLEEVLFGKLARSKGRVGWSLTTFSVFDTQMAQLCCNDYWRLFYRFGVIVIAALVTGASCDDPAGDDPRTIS